MNWILSFLASLVCGAVGLLTTGAVAAAYADWYQMSTREGQASFFVAGMALLGGIVCCILGFVLARVLGTEDVRGFLRAAGVAIGSVVLIGAVVAGALYLLADFPPKIGGDELVLEAEIMLPAGFATAPPGFAGETEFLLGSVVNGTWRASRRGELDIAAARTEGGRWIVPAEVFLFTTRGERAIQARMAGALECAFRIPLPARPGPEFEQWSAWLPQPPAGSPSWPDSNPSYRFRVRRLPPPPPPPTAEELAARKAREEQAVFDAIAPDAPIAAWLPYTPSWVDGPRRAAAIGCITSRPDFPKELGVLMVSGDMREAEAAMRFVGDLPASDRSLVPEVQAAGRDLVERLKKVNASTVEEDPTYQAAADFSVRFSAWMSAARGLTDKAGADFVPELREILELSRVRTDSHVMQQDVRRVASYYMKTWAGVEPLPGDPPPR